MQTNVIEGDNTPIVPAKGYLGSVGNLYKLAKDRSPAARNQLAQEVSSILLADITARESEMVSDVLIDLLVELEQNVRKSLAFRLSLLEKAPLRLILELANDEIDVAWPVLTASPVLCDFDLMYIVKAQGPEYWRAIAARKALGTQVTEMLAETGDIDTALTLLENKEIVLSDNTMVILSDLAQEQEVVAIPLLSREEMSRELAHKLYSFVGEEVKRFINDHYECDGEQIQELVEQVVEESVLDITVESEYKPEDYMLEMADVARKKDILNVKMMIGTLRRGHIRSFIAQLSVYTGINSDVISHILKQGNGQGLAVIARAFDFDKQDFISLFMLTGKLWKDGQFIHPEDVRRALKYYDAMTREFALEFIKG